MHTPSFLFSERDYFTWEKRTDYFDTKLLFLESFLAI